MKLIYIDPHPLTHSIPAVMQIIQTVDALAAAGTQIELVVPAAGPAHAVRAVLGRDFHEAVRLIELPDWRRHWWFPFHSKRPFFRQAKKYLAQNQVDALLVRNLKLAARLLASGVKAPLFFETHEIFSQSFLDAHPGHAAGRSRKHAALWAMEAEVYRKSAGLIAITAALAEDVRAEFKPPAPIAVAPDGVDLAAADAARLRLPSAAPTQPASVLYLGSLHQWKGVETLISAMRDVSGAQLHIAGGEDHRIQALTAYARAQGVFDRVQFLGKIPPAQRFDCIAAAALCVLPLTHHSIASRYTSPLKLFEYMAMAKPIIAGDLPALREVLSHEVNALLVPPEEPQALAAAINRLLREPALAQALGTMAGKAARAYSWDARAQTLLALMRGRLEPML